MNNQETQGTTNQPDSGFGSSHCSTAEERGMQMMTIPMGQLPELASEFAKKLCDEAGMCMEVLLTAWTVYAQCVEGFPCEDELYKARPEDVEWFNARLGRQNATDNRVAEIKHDNTKRR